MNNQEHECLRCGELVFNDKKSRDEPCKCGCIEWISFFNQEEIENER